MMQLKMEKFSTGKQGTKKERAKSKKEQFFIKYNLTKELITHNGRVVSDAILLKANKFLELGCIEHVHNERLDIHTRKRTYICKPIKGYNQTTYTMNIMVQDERPIIISCNCQYCGMHERVCSHIYALLIKTNLVYDTNYRIRAGVRKK